MEWSNPFPSVSPQFAALGETYQTADLVWSAIAPEKMTQEEAAQYCRGLGGGSRLPTRKDFEALALVMKKDTASGYDPSLVPGIAGHHFWSDTVYKDYNIAYVFDGDDAKLLYYYRTYERDVRCVTPLVSFKNLPR